MYYYFHVNNCTLVITAIDCSYCAQFCINCMLNSVNQLTSNLPPKTRLKFLILIK